MFLALALLLAAPVEVPLAPCAWVRAENDGAGGGFVIDTDKRLLVTCRHVVADRKKVDVFFPWYRDGELVTLRVPKAETARVTARLLAEQEVLDLNVEDPPIEDVIELVFARDAVE